MLARPVHRFSPRLAVIAVALYATPALSQPAAPVRWRLAWTRGEGAESCPAGSDLEARVRARLGRDPFHQGEGPAIEAVVEREDREWVARIYAHDGASGTRELRSGDERCDALADTAALAMALVIDPDASHHAPPAAAPPRAAVTTVTPAPPRAPRTAYGHAAVQWVAAPGLLDGFDWAVGFAAQAPVGATWRVDGGAWLVAPRRTQGADVFELSAALARIGLCAVVARARRIDVDVCGDVTVGWVQITAVDPLQYVEVRQGARVASMVGASAGLTWRVAGPLALRVELGAQVPWIRPSYAVEGRAGVRSVFQAWPVVPWFAVGPAIRF